MLFGAIPMAFHSTTTKIHELGEPRSVMLSKVFALLSDPGVDYGGMAVPSPQPGAAAASAPAASAADVFMMLSSLPSHVGSSSLRPGGARKRLEFDSMHGTPSSLLSSTLRAPETIPPPIPPSPTHPPPVRKEKKRKKRRKETKERERKRGRVGQMISIDLTRSHTNSYVFFFFFQARITLDVVDSSHDSGSLEDAFDEGSVSRLAVRRTLPAPLRQIN